MPQSVGCLTREEYHCVRDAIRRWKLWWDEDEPPSRLSPALMMRGWLIETVATLAPLGAVAFRRGRVKRLLLQDGAPLSIQATAIAHTLAHDLLGHTQETDLIAQTGVWELIRNGDVHPAHDRAAAAAAALLLIPDRFVDSGMSAREISSWCGVPLDVVQRRLSGTIIIEDLPPTILRFERHGSGRRWGEPPQMTGTDTLTMD